MERLRDIEGLPRQPLDRRPLQSVPREVQHADREPVIGGQRTRKHGGVEPVLPRRREERQGLIGRRGGDERPCDFVHVLTDACSRAERGPIVDEDAHGAPW